MKTVLGTGDKLIVDTPDAKVEVLASSARGGSYTSIEIVSTDSKKPVSTKRYLLSKDPTDIEPSFVRVTVAEDSKAEVERKKAESEQVRRIVAKIKHMHDQARKDRLSYNERSHKFHACRGAENALDALLVMIETGNLDG